MTAHAGCCSDCGHPWSFHPTVSAGSPWAGCTAVLNRPTLPGIRDITLCACRAVFPGHVSHPTATAAPSELELRGQWGDR